MGVPMELEDEETWLCGRIIRLRMALRLTSDPRTDATADDEERQRTFKEANIGRDQDEVLCWSKA